VPETIVKRATIAR